MHVYILTCVGHSSAPSFRRPDLEPARIRRILDWGILVLPFSGRAIRECP